MSVPNSRQRQASATTILSDVRAAAEALVTDLQAAEQLTGGWSDRPLTEKLVNAALSDGLTRLAATGCGGPDNRLPSSELWRIAGPLLECGSLPQRARSKPLGYAGDHVMLARICAQEVCDHPLGWAMDRFFQAQAAPRAVRARTKQMAAVVAAHASEHRESDFHLVSIGSGPAIDVQGGLEALSPDRRRHVRVTLLDLDPAALDSAQGRLDPLLSTERLTCLRENLFRLARRRAFELSPAKADLLICSGLFDYLEDEAAAELLRWCWERLSDTGRLLVGNFSPDNPSRAYMEWIGNWYLNYRDAEDMLSMAREAGIPRACTSVATEPTGTILLLEVSRS